ncbi:MAG: rhomboid family intramembrane serine protease [Lachnospiraceae bacterium]|nr:rhomboid family intramembrane serine protease [Lachnospiraceae bacterium]
MLEKLERKLGKYAIPNLINYLIGGYIIGYLFMLGSQISNINFIGLMTLEPYYIIHDFQLWRLVTWVLVPPRESIIFALIMMFFYWQLGRVLEQTIGTFRFNVYIFGGIIFTIIGAFALYGIYYLVNGVPILMSAYFSTNYINLSIFLAFALCYPNMEVYLYFLIPIKMKWMAVVYAVFIIYEFFMVGWAGRVAIFASLLNFILFFLMTRNYRRVDPREIKRKAQYRKATTGSAFGGEHFKHQSNSQTPRHKCAICGRTDVSNPELEFRFCSKCNGNYEYCNEHLFTHTHVK